jgi:hypothetical protein
MTFFIKILVLVWMCSDVAQGLSLMKLASLFIRFRDGNILHS